MVRTRIAPSPTGFPHIGTIYQVLFDYAFARKNNGQFILRLEDTDRSRLVEGAEQVIYSALDWFGLAPDESPVKGGPHGPYRQSERLAIYKKYAQELLEKGHAYYCFCTKERLEAMRKGQMARKENPRYDRTCRSLPHEQVEKQLKEKKEHVIRMRVPDNETIVLHDMVMGDISFESNGIDDQVILKSDGYPTYHLGVVVDDHLMEISHVIRGREWVSSTPKHILLYRFFGWSMPQHAHLPLILNTDGKGKLSKRHGHASVDYYRKLGYLPDAVLNYLSNLVWFHPENKEVYPLDEFIGLVDLTKINSQGARFNLDKLDWMNGEYMRQTQNEKLKAQIYSFYEKKPDEELIGKTIPLVKERMKKLSDYMPLCAFLFEETVRPEIDLSGKKELLAHIVSTLEKITDWKAEKIGDAMVTLAKKLGVKNGEFFMTLRIAVTGKKISPPLNESMELLGKEKTLKRIRSIV